MLTINRSKIPRYMPDYELEAQARRILNEFDYGLLRGEPKAVPVEKLAESYGLEIEYHCIRKNGAVLGKTVFFDQYVPIYNRDEGRYEMVFFKRGTVILDESLLDCANDGRLRFTLAHELAHWILHQDYYAELDEEEALEYMQNGHFVNRKI